MGVCTYVRGNGENNDIIEGWGGEIEKREKSFSKRWLILGFLVFNCSTYIGTNDDVRLVTD